MRAIVVFAAGWMGVAVLVAPPQPLAAQQPGAVRVGHKARPGVVSVPTAPPEQGVPQSFRDGKFGVRFQVPPGWGVSKKDGEVSTFRLDARTARARAEMRLVATLQFNPFPLSTLSGATFYYSVERHANDAECAAQAAGLGDGQAGAGDGVVPGGARAATENIGGMDFAHGHDEHGQICVEARDEVYTAYRKGSCYRFDLTVNTFCSVSSGAQDLSDAQMRDIEARMSGILSTVALDWEKRGPVEVPVPEVSADPRVRRGRKQPTPSAPPRSLGAMQQGQ